jgi:acyl carrier protein
MKTIDKWILNKVSQINESNNGAVAGFDSDTPFVAMGISSLDYIQLIIEIENEFNIELDDETLAFGNELCCGKLADVIKRKLGRVYKNEDK